MFDVFTKLKKLRNRDADNLFSVCWFENQLSPNSVKSEHIDTYTYF